MVIFMSEADKIFEEQGYIKNDEAFEAEVFIKDFERVIFDKFNKFVFCEVCYEAVPLRMNLLKVIYKKCEELGWLDKE